MSRPKLALASVTAGLLLLAGGTVMAVADGPDQVAACDPSPTISSTDGGRTFAVECTVPAEPAATVTVTAAAPTVTVTATPAPSTPAPSASSSTPSTSPTATPSPSQSSATPTPTATPVGDWPGASNTGVPAGTTLTAYTGPSVITQAGTVIDSKTVSVCLDIRANNVTIRNSRFDASCFYNILSDNGNTGITITDTEVRNRNGSGDSSINGGGFTCTRCNIWGASDGIKAQSNVVIRDTWIHDQAQVGSDPHNDGIQSLGTTSLTIEHNTIEMKAGATSAIILSTGSASAMKNVLINNNLMSGGAFTVYGGYEAGRDTRSKVDNIRVTNNKFSTKVYPRSGAYGPLTSVDSPVVVSGNTWFDGPNAGKTVS